MLQDRPYMRDGYERRQTSIVTWILCSMAGVFIVQNVFAHWLPIGLEWQFGLSPAGLRAGHVWTLLTYGFLHSTSNLLQVVAYLLAVYFFGREVLPILGNRRFIGFYAAALAAGGGLLDGGPLAPPRAAPRSLRGRGRARDPVRLLLPQPGDHAAPLLRPARHDKAQVPRLRPSRDRPRRLRVLRAVRSRFADRRGPLGAPGRHGRRLGLLPFHALVGLELRLGARAAGASRLDEAAGLRDAGPAPELQRQCRRPRAPARRGRPDPRQDQQRRIRIPVPRRKASPRRGQGPAEPALAPCGAP